MEITNYDLWMEFVSRKVNEMTAYTRETKRVIEVDSFELLTKAVLMGLGDFSTVTLDHIHEALFTLGFLKDEKAVFTKEIFNKGEFHGHRFCESKFAFVKRSEAAFTPSDVNTLNKFKRSVYSKGIY